MKGHDACECSKGNLIKTEAGGVMVSWARLNGPEPYLIRLHYFGVHL